MNSISAETCAKNCVYTIKANEKVDKDYLLWIRMIDIQKSLGVENICNLIRKEIQGKERSRL